MTMGARVTGAIVSVVRLRLPARRFRHADGPDTANVHDARGTVLLEVIIAFVVAGVVITAAMLVFNNGLHSSVTLRERLILVELAKSKLSEIQALQPIAAVHRSGQIGPHHVWSLEYSELPGPETVAEKKVRPVWSRLNVQHRSRPDWAVRLETILIARGN